MPTPIRIGITGATGQVGSRLLQHLQDAGFTVVAAVRNALGAALCDAVAPGADIRIGSLIPDNGQPHLLDDCDVIVNCAIESAGGIPRQAYTRNRALIDGLLQAKALKRLVHFSTVAVYGELITNNPRPGSEYGRSKLYVERYALRQARRRGVRCTAIRLGHVYGAGIARSREILELARTPGFELPFGGRLPSNAIHADDVGAAIVSLLRDDVAGDVYGLTESSHTWRDVFDWHTGCLGLPPVSPMDDADSTAQRSAWADRSVTRDALGWLRGLPIKSLVRAPATFDLALRVLANTPDALTKRVSDFNRRTGARAQVASAANLGVSPVPPVYLSAGMPGPVLAIPSIPSAGFGSEPERARELQEWYDLWRAPRVRAATATMRSQTRARWM